MSLAQSTFFGENETRKELERLRNQAFIANAVKYRKNPILTVGSPGSWDDAAVVSADVIKYGNTYYMFYGGNNRADGKWRTGLALSNDGINWVKYQNNPVINVGTVYDTVFAVIIGNCITYDKSLGKWVMFYQSWTGGTAYITISRAESYDLLHWTKRDDVNPVLSSTSGHMKPVGIVYDQESSEYVLYVNFADNTIQRYVSSNGISFTFDRNVNVVKPQEYDSLSYEMTLQKIGRLYILEAHALRLNAWEIILFLSYDGVNFFPYARNPILTTYPKRGNAWDTSGVVFPFIFYEEDKIWLYYTGFTTYTSPFLWQIGLAFLNQAIFERLTDVIAIYGWNNTSISAGASASIIFPINLLGYDTKSLYFGSSATGNLTISVDPIGDGNFTSISTSSNISSANQLIDYDFAYLQLTFSNTSTVTATVTARLVAGRKK